MNLLCAVAVLGILHLLFHWFLKQPCEISINIPTVQISKNLLSKTSILLWVNHNVTKNIFFRQVKKELEKRSLCNTYSQLCSYTHYQFPIITKYDVQFLKIHLQYDTCISHCLKIEKIYQRYTDILSLNINMRCFWYRILGHCWFFLTTLPPKWMRKVKGIRGNNVWSLQIQYTLNINHELNRV